MWPLLLSLARAEPALTWWAEDDAQAAEIAAALAATWPDAPIAVVADAPPPGEADGVFWGDDGLLLIAGDQQRSHGGVLDAYAAAALARSWSRDIEAPEALPPAELLPPPPRPPRPPASAEPGWGWSVSGGPASRRPQPGPAFHFAGQLLTEGAVASMEFAPAERVVLRDEYELSAGGLTVQRLGVTAGARRERPLQRGWTLEAALSAGARVHLFADIQPPLARDALWLPTASARLRAWAPQAGGQQVRLGGGLMVSVDGLRWGQSYPTDALEGSIRPLTVAAEIGVLRL